MLRKGHLRHNANAGDDQIGAHIVAACETDAGNVRPSLHNSWRSAEHEADALPCVLIQEKAGDLGAGHTRQWARRRLNHGHIEPALARDSRNFEANIPCTHHRELGAGHKTFADGIHVRGGTKAMHPRQVRAGKRQFAWSCASGEHECVIPDLSTTLEPHALVGTVDPDRAYGCQQGNILIRVDASGAQEQPVHADLAGKVFLGERRALVGRRGFFADQGNVTLEASLAQPLCGLAASLARANYDNPFDLARAHNGVSFGGITGSPQAGLDAAPAGMSAFRMVSASALIDSRQVSLPDPAATTALGGRIGAKLAPGEVVCLRGGLGAGKTTLARGVIAAWTGQDQEAPSPTYTLVQTYEGPRGMLWHFDLYRLKHPEEVWELGFEDALREVSLIEWPEQIDHLLPAERLVVDLLTTDEGRTAHLSAHGAWRTKLATL